MKYRTTAIISFPPGTALELSREQAAARAHALDKRGNKYVARESVQFKAGEVIGLVSPAKSMLASLQKLEAEA